MSLVEKRYAEAFLDLATKTNSVDEYLEELKMVSDIYQNYSLFCNFLNNPQIDNLTKKHFIKDVFEEKTDINILNLLLLLIDKDRLKNLPEICNEFIDLADKYNNILNITIIYAETLSQESIDEICEKFKKLYNSKSVRASMKIDESLIGGIKVAVGDKLYDGTLKGKISILQSVLMAWIS